MIFSNKYPLNLGNDFLKSGRVYSSYANSPYGVPNILKILKIWSISESPVIKGHILNSSAIISPTGQVSIPKQYSSKPNRISGAQYQRVSTSWVKAQ